MSAQRASLGNHSNFHKSAYKRPASQSPETTLSIRGPSADSQHQHLNLPEDPSSCAYAENNDALVVFQYNPVGREENEQWTQARVTSSRRKVKRRDDGVRPSHHRHSFGSSSHSREGFTPAMSNRSSKKRAKISKSSERQSFPPPPRTPVEFIFMELYPVNGFSTPAIGASADSTSTGANYEPLNAPDSPQILTAAVPNISRKAPRNVLKF